MKIGIVGVGCVGTALQHILCSFKPLQIYVYDKFKHVGSIQSCFNTEICFLTLPTELNTDGKYNLEPLDSTLTYFSKNSYQGIVVVKSTVIPSTCEEFLDKYPNLQIVHNPEFLSAKTAYFDLRDQKHIVIGRTDTVLDENVDKLRNFFKRYFSNAEISLCTSTESEMMKMCCNTFYASKIQIMTEFYMACRYHGIEYSSVRNLILKNQTISKMHTAVPGHDGQISFGGACFPKDIGAFVSHLKEKKVICEVLSSVLSEQRKCRRKI